MDRRKQTSTLTQLRGLSSSRPRTKIGQIIWAWPEIEAALASGWKLKEVWEAASRDGIEMSYAQFRVYVSKVRRRGLRPVAVIEQPPPVAPIVEPSRSLPPPRDPFRNLREQEEKKKRSSFEYDPFSINKDLI
jgi:hypothetical protein